MKVKELIDLISKNDISFFEIVQYIEKNSTDSSRELLLNEIYGAFKMKSLDFMFEVKEEDISDAINQFEHKLEYLYLSEEDKLKVQHFIKEIDNKLTIFNVGGFSKIEEDNKTQVIYLNNLMIEYHDGFFQHEIKGFENLNHFKSVCESLKVHFKNPEIEESEEINEIYDLLNTIRNKDHTDLQLYNIIKERTQLNKDALKYLYKDIEVYLFSEKDDYECNFSEDETEQAIEDLKKKGHTEDDLIMLGYIKKGKVLDIKTNDLTLDYTYINKEKLFFPLEFFPIYQLQGLINAELSKIQEKEQLVNPQTISTPKLKTDLSVPQLALLFKMINDLKPKIFNTKSDAELFRFISANFQTKKSTENGISTQKLRNEFNTPNLKAIEFWEKHLRTMISESRKFK